MEGVTKTYFDPLLSTKTQIKALLNTLPTGSAHPYSPSKQLLCRTTTGIKEIDISKYDDTYFYNAVDLGELGEVLEQRIQNFPAQLSGFNDFTVQQVPSGSFDIPIVTGGIAIIALSERSPTYYDLCLANKAQATCCYANTRSRIFEGVIHSGDHNSGRNFLAFVTLDAEKMTTEELCVFISGYSYTQITKFLGTHPALLLANHVDKILYMVPVPLDAATIGEATLCCPLVIQRQGNKLKCHVIPTATTDVQLSCTGSSLKTPLFEQAINSARLMTVTNRTAIAHVESRVDKVLADAQVSEDACPPNFLKKAAYILTQAATLPASIDAESTQVIRFGKGIEFVQPEHIHKQSQIDELVLPCVWGAQLSGPLILCTGKAPRNVSFTEAESLLEYYRSLESLVLIVDDTMTDNARNLAPPFRFNAVFVVQPSSGETPDEENKINDFLDGVNINAVTALAGPLALILVQLGHRYFFYRGLAAPEHLNTTKLTFGADVTKEVNDVGLANLVLPNITRVVNVDKQRSVLMLKSRSMVPIDKLKTIFNELPLTGLDTLQEDVVSISPQLQVLLGQKELTDLSGSLIAALSAKIGEVVAPLRREYIAFAQEGLKTKTTDPEYMKKKANLLGQLRKLTKDTQTSLNPIITALSQMTSARTTSKRSYDLKRLLRSSQIQANVEAAKSVTFETLAGYLETYAAEVGTLLLNINSEPYQALLGDLDKPEMDASKCCSLESRILYLAGLDAGILLEQSQAEHNGPLRSTSGPTQPVLALTNLVQASSEKSMLAWVCWDEFVELESPFGVRWIEKCNEPHIAALRIIMRATLSEAVASREFNLQPSSPQTGQLMSALLMAAMSKLATSKAIEPEVSKSADDTVTKLMRGLYGNLLTIAGSGVKPMSMVWQLFGADSQCDVPTNEADWSWYETAITLYPYTSWPRKMFHLNLQKLLDKAIIRLVTKNEDVSDIKKNKVEAVREFCRLRNIQLDHSRTIVTILMQMLTEEGADISGISERLLNQLPKKLKRQSQSYTRLIRYLEHLSKGGERRAIDDALSANVYTRRSGVFTDLKAAAAKASEDKDWFHAKEACQAVLDAHVATAQLWQVDADTLTLQNADVYKSMQAFDFVSTDDKDKQREQSKIVGKVVGDAEIHRVPWQIGKAGQYGPEIEPLDENLLHAIMTGEEPSSATASAPKPKSSADETNAESTTLIKKELTVTEQIATYASSLSPSFNSAMQKELTANEICHLLGMPKTTLRVFAKALNPEFDGADLGRRFKHVILELLMDRSNRDQVRPSRKLLGLDA